MKDLITVVVPIYNVEKYLKKCIESIINQTYKNIEIILVDDGSTDNCKKISDEYAQNDSRITVIHKNNGGLSDARNTGIKHAKGKFIAFVDSDDYIEQDMIEYLYNLIIENNADISICDYQEIFEDRKIIKKEIKENIQVLNNEEALKKLLIDDEIRSHAWDKLYKTELFRNIEYPIGRKMEDIGTTYRLFEISGKIVLSNIPKYVYLQRNNSIMGLKNIKMYIDYYELAYIRYKEIKAEYKMIENDISLLKAILELYNSNNKDIYEYIKQHNIGKIYNNTFKSEIFNTNISKKDKLKLLLLRINKKIYKLIYSVYMNRKKGSSK